MIYFYFFGKQSLYHNTYKTIHGIGHVGVQACSKRLEKKDYNLHVPLGFKFLVITIFVKYELLCFINEFKVGHCKTNV